MNSKSDRGPLSLGILLVLVSSYFMFFRFERTSHLKALGTLSQTQSVVKTKNALALDWQDGHIGHEVSENQLIYTDDQSSAEIEFNQGGEIKVGENSLIKVASVGKEAAFNLGKGIVRAKLEGDRPFTLEMNGEEYQLVGKDAELQINLMDQKGEIGVIAGALSVQTQGTTQVLDPNLALLIDGNKIEAKRIHFSTSAPTRDQIFYTDKNSLALHFSWTPEEKANILISKSVHMEGPSITEGEVGVGIDLVPGKYYWKIKNENGRSLTSAFEIRAELPPRVLRPLDGEKFGLPTDETGSAEVRLQWLGEPQLNYRIEWEQKELQTMVQKGGNALFKITESGVFRWRVRIEDENRALAKWSEWQSIDLKLAPVPLIPSHLFPDGIEYQTYERPKESVEMTWASTFPIEWELERPSGEIETQTVEGNFLNYVAIEVGQYRWRTRSFNEFYLKSAWTEWKIFEVTDLSNEKSAGVQRIQLKKPNQKVNFSWASPRESTNVFELARDNSFKDIISKQEVKGGEAQVIVGKLGSYFWRSRQFLPDGTVNSSEPIRVIIEPAPGPQKPEKFPDMEVPLEWESAEKKSTWNILEFFISSAFAKDPRGVVKVKLPASDDIKAFQVRIFRDPELKDLILEENFTGEMLEWVGALPGTYYWQYAIIDHWDRMSPFSDSAVLNVVTQDSSTPGRSLLIRPIRAVEVTQEGLIFNWSHANNVTQYQLQISRDANFDSVFFETKTQVIEFDARALKFERGLHYWRIWTLGKSSLATPSSTGRFVFKSVSDQDQESGDEEKNLPSWKKNWKNRVSVAWAPSKDGYQFSQDGQSGSIDGNALMGIEVKATYFYPQWTFSAEVLRQTGKVFEGQSYLFQRALLDLGRSLKWGGSRLSFGLGIGQSAGQEYSIEASAVKATPISGFSYGPVIRVYQPLNEEWELQSKVYYLLGPIKQIELGAEGIRHHKSFFTLGGFSIAQREYVKNTGKQSSLRLSFGLGKEF